MFDVLESDAVEKADVVVVDSASALIPEGMDASQHLASLQKLRKICSESRSLLLTVDPHEMMGNYYTNYVHHARFSSI